MKQAKRVSSVTLQHAVRDGVERAIAARQAAGVELSAEDLNAVGGGLIAGWEIRGGRLIDAIVGPQNPGIDSIGKLDLGAGPINATLPGAVVTPGQTLGA